MKLIKYCLWGIFLPLLHVSAQQTKIQTIRSGKIMAANTSEGLANSTLIIKGSKLNYTSDAQGNFTIPVLTQLDTLLVSHVGYGTQRIILYPADKKYQLIYMQMSDGIMDQVVVSTGYQKISKERTTGSFDYVDNSLLNRSVSTNILDRLNGVASSVFFTTNPTGGGAATGGDPSISIRGRSTLFANTNPLIVLDNFPYDGDLKNINPNDVESITVLKDAAAASIWGVQAANGVIVVTTKRGKYNGTPKISFNSNITVSDKPNVYATPQLTSSDFIDVQTFLFNKGYYNLNLNYFPYNYQTPVVDILNNRKRAIISAADSATQVDALRKIDARDQYSKYFLRKPINQQYAVNISGGGQNQQYYFSAGYDKNLAANVPNTYDRITVNANNTYRLLDQRLELTSGIAFTSSQTKSNLNSYSPKYPYEQIADADGNPLPVYHDYRKGYIDTVGQGNLLDWTYTPLYENNNNSVVNLTDYRVSTNLDYKIIPGLRISINYLFEKGVTDQTVIHPQSSYYTRNLINEYSQINYSTGSVTRPIPLGDIVFLNNSSFTTNYGRGQLSYDRVFHQKSNLTALAGWEIRDFNSIVQSSSLAGYSGATATNIPIDFVNLYPNLVTQSLTKLPVSPLSSSGITNHVLSYYANAAYTYDNKYIISVSARKDESNLFGVSANQKGVPLWSTGVSWEINREAFYHINWLPYLKLRITNGYNGNVSQSLSAFTTAQIFSGTNAFNEVLQQIVNPPNPSLSWEKVHVINVGIDYATKNNTVSGSIEGYVKKGLNLIGNSPIAPQTGIFQFTGNTSNVLTKGIDVTINTKNLNGKLKWYTTLLASYMRDKVTSYKVTQATNAAYVSGNYTNPLKGKPYAAIFSFKYAGLDSAGNPRGYLNGKISEDYTHILNSTDISQLEYKGTATPLVFGALRNSFDYGPMELSFNIAYKLGYYFRRGSLNYGSLFAGSYGQADYGKRWKKPGDEKYTTIPSMIYPANGNRDNFYKESDVLIEKGDNIRLQDIQVSYNFSGYNLSQSPFTKLKLYLYCSNLGVIWKANRSGLDPNYINNGIYLMPNPKTFAIGLTVNFK